MLLMNDDIICWINADECDAIRRGNVGSCPYNVKYVIQYSCEFVY